MTKCILFDLDGTLVTTGGAGLRALEKAVFSLYGIRDSMKEVNPAGKTDPAIIREIFMTCLQRDCTIEEMDAVQKKYLEFLVDECEAAEDYQVMDGIPVLLERLKEMRMVMGLGTGNLERGARIKLQRSKLNSFLPFGGFGSDAEDRAELLKIARRRAEQTVGTRFDSQNVFVVGDTERDILAARRAKFKVIAVATGNTPEELLKEHRPDYFLKDFGNDIEFLNIILNGHSE